MEKLVIIGGGVAGLSCLNALLDKNIDALLVDASRVGLPKICGEFIAPPAVKVLTDWGMESLQTISQAHFFSQSRRMQFNFPHNAGACARSEVELALAARANRHGGRIIEQCPIQSIIPSTDQSPFILKLTSGKDITSKDVIFATGRCFSGLNQSKPSGYIGFKTHLSGVIEPNTLQMYSLNGGYFGIVPIDSNQSNLTCLVKRDQAKSTKTYLLQWMKAFNPSSEWLEGEAPSFGVKLRPHWPHAYWIGDAFASFYPAIGYGLSHSVLSALLAVEYYLKGDSIAYHQELKRRLQWPRLVASSMHQVLQKPRLSRGMAALFAAFDGLRHRLLTSMDY